MKKRSSLPRPIFVFALMLALGVLSVAELVASEAYVGGGIWRIFIAGTETNTIDGLNFSTGITATPNGSTLDLTATGGGTPDDNSVTTAKIANGEVKWQDIQDGGIALLNLSGSLQSSLVFYNDAGVIAGYLTGSSAYTTACYGDGGLSDGSACVTQRGVTSYSPLGFYIHDQDDAGATVVRAVLPPHLTRVVVGNVTTGGATAVQCADFVMGANQMAAASITYKAYQIDAGGFLAAKYLREAEFHMQDGGVATSIGGLATIGTDREAVAGWTGPSTPTFDGSVVQINWSGAAGETTTVECTVELQDWPRGPPQSY